MLHTKWNFEAKTDAGGQVERFIARLTDFENKQHIEVDQLHIYAAFMDMYTVNIVLELTNFGGVLAHYGVVINE